MITILAESNEDLLAVQVSGKFTTQDFETYKTLLLERMKKHGTARLYFEMKDFEGWQPVSFVENAFFDLLHGHEYDRVAMVGEQQWQHWAARLASPVKKKGIRYFDLSEQQKAKEWILAN